MLTWEPSWGFPSVLRYFLLGLDPTGFIKRRTNCSAKPFSGAPVTLKFRGEFVLGCPSREAVEK